MPSRNSDRSSARALLDRLEVAAHRFPAVDALVVSQPDTRDEEIDRQARRLFCPWTTDGVMYAEKWKRRIPSALQSLDRPHVRSDWSYIMREDEGQGRGVWEFAVFAPRTAVPDATPFRLFDLLAAEAARVVLGGNGRGDKPHAGWLIHLADRDDPLTPSARRKHLGWIEAAGEVWRRPDGTPADPIWRPVYPHYAQPPWWAAVLPNVFEHSRLAIEQAVRQAQENTKPSVAMPAVPRELKRMLALIPKYREYVVGKGGVRLMKAAFFKWIRTEHGEAMEPEEFDRLWDNYRQAMNRVGHKVKGPFSSD